MALPASLLRYLAQGEQRAATPEEARAIVLTHSIAFTIGALTLPYAPLFLAIGARGLGLAVVPIAAFYLLLPLFTRGFGFDAARAAIFTLFPCVVSTYAAAFGERSQIHLLFFVTLTMPVVLTAPRERALRSYGVAMPIVCALGLELFGFRLAGEPGVSEAVQQVLRVLLIVTTFAFLLVALLYFARAARRAEASLERRNGQMRLILDRVDQGFLTLDEHGCILPEHSAKVREWLGDGCAGQPFARSVAARDASTGAWLEVGLQQLEDGLLPPSVALDQLPKRMKLGDRTLTLETKLLGERPRRILVVMTDLTDALARDRESSEREDLLQVLERTTKDPHGLRIFQREALRLLGAMDADAAPATRLGALHTLKGNAAVLGLSDVARCCHDLEDRAREVEALTAADVEPLRRKVTRLLALAPHAGELAPAVMSVPRADYEALVLALEDERPYDNVRALASAWATAPVAIHLRRLALQAEQLAERLGKGPITVVVEDDGTRVDERFDELFAVMTHVVRNAVDHGLETADERLRAGKAEAGHLRIVARRESDAICSTVQDDGRGIAWDEVMRRARPGAAAMFSPEEREAALFEAGVSTSAQVTEISGRGVGLAAVKDTVDRLGGVIEVRSTPGNGACFEVRVPWQGPATRGHSVRRAG